VCLDIYLHDIVSCKRRLCSILHGTAAGYFVLLDHALSSRVCWSMRLLPSTVRLDRDARAMPSYISLPFVK